MAATDPRRQRQAAEYGQRLRRALNETGTSIYRLARLINPQAPESARSNIQRYLRGSHLPGAEIRLEVANALGRPELLHVPDDAEERDPMNDLMAALRRVVREELAERVA